MIIELKKYNDEFVGSRHLLALIQDEQVYQYVVCSNFINNEWDYGHYFDADEVSQAVAYFEQYPTINPHRLNEIASQCVGGLIEDDYDSAMEYFRDVLEFTQDECEYFDINYDDMMNE